MRTADGSEYRSWAVLLAVGSTYRRLDIPGEQDFIATDAMLMTNVPGVFAAGDCHSGSTKQAASSAGEGAAVALMIRHYVEPLAGGRPSNDTLEREMADAMMT